MRRRAAALFDAAEKCGAEANMAKLLAADASWEAANACLQTHGGFGFAAEYDVERKFRETRLYQVAPISTNLILSYRRRARAGLAPIVLMIAPLFVPGDRPERFAKALVAGASAVILDLEDAVAPDRKAFARDAIRSALREGIRAWVRVNVAVSEEGISDLQMLRDAPQPLAVMLPKVTGPRDLDAARELLPGVSFVVLVESLDGMRRIDEIAATPNVAALAFGGYDLCSELGARPTAEVLGPWRSRTVFAARVAGIDALDTPFVELDDEAGLALDARRAVDFGFDGKLAIHPKQIAPIRAAFEPSPGEIERARGILSAAAGGGVVRYGNTMIDAPLVAAARRVLSRTPS